MSFETDIKRMEEIADLLRNEDTGLEKAIELYKEATKLGRKLSKTLSEIQKEAEIVTSESEDVLDTEVFGEEEND